MTVNIVSVDYLATKDNAVKDVVVTFSQTDGDNQTFADSRQAAADFRSWCAEIPLDNRVTIADALSSVSMSGRMCPVPTGDEIMKWEIVVTLKSPLGQYGNIALETVVQLLLEQFGL